MQLVSVIEFLEPLIPRREPLCCDKVRQQPSIGIPCTAKKMHYLHQSHLP